MDCFKEGDQGYLCPVDNSGGPEPLPPDPKSQMLEQGGTCPSPLDTLAVPPQESMTLNGVGVGSPTPRVKPSRLPLDPSLDSLLSFFAPQPGVGEVPPDSPVKVGEAELPVMFNDTANLDPDFLKTPLYPPSKCKPRYIVLECGCMKGYADGSKRPKRRIVPSTCMSLDCKSCRPHVGSRRSDAVLKRFMGSTLYQRRQYHTKNLIYTVFTVPKAIREQYLDKNEWQKVRKQAWNILKTYFGARYAVEASHPHGDKNPDIFHPHLNFLWIQEEGHRPFLDVDLLRKKWSAVLKVGVSDVYSQYSNKMAKIIDWCWYVGRTFPGNHKWTGSIRWYGKYPKMKKAVDYVCNDCGTRFKLIGYVLAQDVDNWIEYGQLMGLDPPWEREACIVRVKKRKKKVCKKV